MAFNTQKFKKQKYTPRTATVPVPDLADFFEPNDTPEFIVRGLTGPELASVHESADKHRNIMGIIEGLLSSVSTDQVEALRKNLGITEDVPREIAKRLEMLKIASVSPVVDLEFAVKLADTFPIEFYNLTSKITELTGLGQSPLGKSKPSGKTQTLEPHLHCAIPEGDLCLKPDQTSSQVAS